MFCLNKTGKRIQKLKKKIDTIYAYKYVFVFFYSFSADIRRETHRVGYALDIGEIIILKVRPI